MSGDPAEPGDVSRATAEVVVFDFDGTLVSRDSFLDFAFGYCARRPVRLLLVVDTLNTMPGTKLSIDVSDARLAR